LFRSSFENLRFNEFMIAHRSYVRFKFSVILWFKHTIFIHVIKTLVQKVV